MTDQSTGPSDEMAESASVADAGEPQGADRPGGPRAEPAPPTPQQLDEREARLAQRRRKPMGPAPGGIPESVPDEQ